MKYVKHIIGTVDITEDNNEIIVADPYYLIRDYIISENIKVVPGKYDCILYNGEVEQQDIDEINKFVEKYAPAVTADFEQYKAQVSNTVYYLLFTNKDYIMSYDERNNLPSVYLDWSNEACIEVKSCNAGFFWGKNINFKDDLEVILKYSDYMLNHKAGYFLSRAGWNENNMFDVYTITNDKGVVAIMLDLTEDSNED